MIEKGAVIIMTGVHELREDLANLYGAFEDMNRATSITDQQILRVKIIADRMQWKLNTLEEYARRSKATASKIPLSRLVLEASNG